MTAGSSVPSSGMTAKSAVAFAAAEAAAAAAKAAKATAEFAVIPEDGTEDPSVTARILERQNAKKERNYELADRIRAELKAEGIEITDIPGGAKWKRV